MCNKTILNLYGMAPGSIVDGPGIRFGIFLQGCCHHCPGCHNPKSQPHTNKYQKTIAEIIEEFDKADSCAGITISGGEPFDQVAGSAKLAKAFKEKGTNVWVYTGYLFEDLISFAAGETTSAATEYCNEKFATDVLALLKNIDVLVDGPFLQEEKSYDALFRGSKNQRLIDVPKTLERGEIVEFKQDFAVPERPASW